MSVKSAIPVLLFSRANKTNKTKKGVNKKKELLNPDTIQSVFNRIFVDSLRIKHKRKIRKFALCYFLMKFL